MPHSTCPACGHRLEPEPVQLSLAPSPASAKHRRTDPASARLAAAKAVLRSGTQKWRILEALRGGPLTAEEIATVIHAAYVSISTRCAELKASGWVEPRGTRRTSSGSDADLLHLTAAGLRELDRERVAA